MRYEPPIDHACLSDTIRALYGLPPVTGLAFVPVGYAACYTVGGIEMWGFAQWSALEETLAVVAAALRSHGLSAARPIWSL